MATKEARYLEKARESLAGAESELANGRWNNSVNRSYYACFQAAIAALVHDGGRPGDDGRWSHSAVHAQSVTRFINRQKRIAPEFRNELPHAFTLRQRADYDALDIAEIVATRMVRRAKAFVAAIEELQQ